MIRDCNGDIIGALSVRIPLPHSVAIVEALACRRAVQFSMEIGLREVIFEGDSAVTIQALSNEISDLSTYGHLIEDILCQANGLLMFDFRHVNAI